MRVLITCFSSISNVAAIVPQLSGLVNDYPQHQFVVLSRDFLSPLFDKLPRVIFVGGDIRGAHKSPMGVYKLFKDLKALRPDIVLDMQRSWRTKMISRLFMLSGIKTLAIGFAAAEQKRLIKKGANKYHSTPTIFDRQARLYAKIGLKVNDDFNKLYEPTAEQNEKINAAVKISGLSKQEYCYKRCLCQDVVVQGNPRVYKGLKDELARVLEELER